MPRTSNIQLSPETIAELEQEFFDFLQSLPHDKVKSFLQEFLTKEEKMMLYKRLALYWALLEGIPHSQIQKMLGVSHDTTRIYNAQKNKLSEELKEAISHISKKKLDTQEDLTAKHEEKEIEAKPQEEAVIEVVEEVVITEQPVEAEMKETPSQEEGTEKLSELEEKMENENEPKKKSGLAKFFGF